MVGPASRATCAALLVLLFACHSALAHGDRRVHRRLPGGLTVGTARHGDPPHLGATPDHALEASMTLSARQAALPPGQATGALATSWCGEVRTTDDTAHEVDPRSYALHAVYAYPSDRASRFGTYANVIQQLMKNAADSFSAASGGQQSLRLDQGTTCGSPYVDISVVQLPYTTAQLQQYSQDHGGDPLSLLVKAARQAVQIPWNSGPRNLVIFADYHEWTGWAGMGYRTWDQSPEQTNDASLGVNDAAVFGFGTPWFQDETSAYSTLTTLHEITHTLGAVGDDSPHSTRYGHCNDEWDTMCYQDGGPVRQTMTYPCGGDTYNQTYDCGKDDYYSRTPAPGSYLATHWNVARSLDVCATGDCGTSRAALNTTLTADHPQPYVGQYVDITANRDPAGPPVVGYRWDYDGDHVWDSGFAGSNAGQVSSDTDQHQVNVQTVYADGRTSTNTLDLTARPEAPTVQLSASTRNPRAGEPVSVTAIAGGDSTPLDSWEWTDNGNLIGYQDPQHMSTAWASPGTHVIEVRATTQLGAGVTAQITIDVQNPPPADPGGAGTTGTSTPGGSPPPSASVKGVTVTGGTAPPALRLDLIGSRFLRLEAPKLTLRGPRGTLATVTLRVSRRVGRRLRLRSTTLVSRDVVLHGTTAVVKLRIPGRVRRSRLRRIPATLELTDNVERTVTRAVTLTR